MIQDISKFHVVCRETDLELLSRHFLVFLIPGIEPWLNWKNDVIKLDVTYTFRALVRWQFHTVLANRRHSLNCGKAPWQQRHLRSRYEPQVAHHRSLRQSKFDVDPDKHTPFSEIKVPLLTLVDQSFLT